MQAVISPFVKPGCTCRGCRLYGEHEDPTVFRGFHVITLTHGPGTDAVSCRCGWLHTDWPDKVGAAIAGHRATELADTLAWQARHG